MHLRKGKYEKLDDNIVYSWIIHHLVEYKLLPVSLLSMLWMFGTRLSWQKTDKYETNSGTFQLLFSESSDSNELTYDWLQAVLLDSFRTHLNGQKSI